MKAQDEQDLARWLDAYLARKYGRQLNPYFRGTVTAFATTGTGAYLVSIKRTGETKADGNQYAVLGPYVPVIGDVVECVWRDNASGWVLGPLIPVPVVGGGGGIWELVWTYIRTNPTDPISTVILSGNYVVFIYFHSSGFTGWDTAGPTHVVGAGKTLTWLEFRGDDALADFGSRKIRLQNVTDAVTLSTIANVSNAAEMIFTGDLGPGSFPVVAAGKTVQPQIWNVDANRRSNGGVFICYES